MSETFAIEDTSAQFAIEDSAGDTLVFTESVYRGALKGPQGDPGSGGATTYLHTQSVDSDTWVVVHNFGRRVNISVTTVGGVQVRGAVTQVSPFNVSTIYFAQPLSGFALVE